MDIIPLLKKKKMTQKELADKLGVSKSYISRWASQKHDLYFNNAIKLADATGSTLEELRQYTNKGEEENNED